MTTSNQFLPRKIDTLPQLPPSSIPPIPNITISVTAVTKLLSDFNPHEATGPGCIAARILKVAAEEIAPALSLIFQKSLETGDIPSSCVKMSPPYSKKGNRTDASNYRPVSLTAITSKVPEHIIHSHSMNHFDSHSILFDKQHGFRSKHSCESQLIMTVNDLALSLDNRSQTDMIIMDFSKAFDSIPPQPSPPKLNHFDIQNNLLVWISNFLKHREKRSLSVENTRLDQMQLLAFPRARYLAPFCFLLISMACPPTTVLMSDFLLTIVSSIVKLWMITIIFPFKKIWLLWENGEETGRWNLMPKNVSPWE